MEGLPRVFVVMAALGVVEGVSVFVVSVELWPGQLAVRVAARQSEVTERLDAADAEQMASWTQLARLARMDQRPLPQSPDARLLGRAVPRVKDDQGATYELRSGQVGGSTTRWRAEWLYSPEPQAGTAALIVSAGQMDVAADPVIVALR